MVAKIYLSEQFYRFGLRFRGRRLSTSRINLHLYKKYCERDAIIGETVRLTLVAF